MDELYQELRSRILNFDDNLDMILEEVHNAKPFSVVHDAYLRAFVFVLQYELSNSIETQEHVLGAAKRCLDDHAPMNKYTLVYRNRVTNVVTYRNILAVSLAAANRQFQPDADIIHIFDGHVQEATE